jgi:hypothetical protein
MAVSDSLNFVRAQGIESQPPPRLVSGPLAWIRNNLLSSPLNVTLTLLGSSSLRRRSAPPELPRPRRGLDGCEPGRLPAGGRRPPGRSLLGLRLG